MISEQVIGDVTKQDPSDHLKGVCHFKWVEDPSPNAICGATPTAWADCNYADYCGDHCKCGKPLCQLCEIAIASGA